MKGDCGGDMSPLYSLRVNLAWFPCKIILRLLPSSLDLAQDTKLAESGPRSSAQKNVHRVQGRVARVPPLAVA